MCRPPKYGRRCEGTSAATPPATVAVAVAVAVTVAVANTDAATPRRIGCYNVLDMTGGEK